MSPLRFTTARRRDDFVKRAMRSTPFTAFAAIALSLLAAMPALAGSTQTGTLRGRIVDTKGEPLPGVVVLLRSDALIRERALSTDVEGNYFVAGLPAGRYSVTAQLAGFLSIQVDALVEIDQVTLLRPITLREGQIQETVAVVADQPIVDKTRTEGSVEITKEFTEMLPVGRSYQALLEFAPGVVDVSGEGNPNILGGTQNSNEYLVDGVSGRDPVTGTFGFNLNYDAIDTVDVKLSGISAEYGQFQGGLTNLTTKSGGNEFSGSVRDVVTAPSWTTLYTNKSQNEFRPDNPDPAIQYRRPRVPGRSPGDDDKTTQVGITLGGPVVTDNAWFFLAYNTDRARANLPLGNPSGGMNGDGNYIDTFEGESALGKLTWQASQNHRLQYQYSRDPADTSRCYGEIFFGGPCYEDYNVDFQGQGGFVWLANWNAVWGSTLVTDLKVARFKNHFTIQPLTPIPVRPGLPLPSSGQPAPAVELATGSTYDANVFSEDPELRLRTQYEGSLTKFFDAGALGSHTFKVGADYQTQEQEGGSALQGDGLFFFLQSQPVSPAGVYDISNRSYLLWYDFAPLGEEGPVNNYSVLYAQDDWQLNDRLSFNIGLRFEKSVNENDVGEKIIDDEGFAPRLGVSWDITGEGRDVVKATAARYLAGINLTTLSPFARNAGGQSSYDVYYNLDYPNAGTPNWVLIQQTRPDPDTSTFAPGIKPQAIDEYTLAYERRLTPTFAVGARAVDREWHDIITTSYTYDYSTGLPRQIVRIDNNDDAKRNFRGLILSADKRLSAGWQLAGSYVYSRSEGNVTTEQSFDLFGAYPGVPQSTKNRFGLLPWDTKHAFKAQGFWTAPLRGDRHGLTLGATYAYLSGTPYARNNTAVNVVVGPGADGIQDQPLGSPGGTAAPNDQSDTLLEFYERRGSRRSPAQQAFDLSANYNFRLVKDLVFQARLEIFNVTNEQDFDTVSTTWYPNPSSVAENQANYVFGHPTAYSNFLAPRTFRVQFALTW